MNAAVAGEQIVVPIGQDRYIESEGLDARGDLLDLPLAMKPGIAGVKFEPLSRNPLDPKLTDFARPHALRPSWPPDRGSRRPAVSAGATLRTADQRGGGSTHPAAGRGLVRPGRWRYLSNVELEFSTNCDRTSFLAFRAVSRLTP